MAITLVRIEPIEKAFARLREAPLEAAGEEKIFIYHTATMRLADFLPNELNPTSLYILKDKLKLMRDIRKQLLDQYQIDILRLSDVLHLKTEDGKIFGMAPPFVEIYEERIKIVPLPKDRKPPHTLLLQIPILKDGIHRTWIAREENVAIRCIVVHGALKENMPYAYPNHWSEVNVYETKPNQPKYYRRQNQYSYMRPLSTLRQTDNNPSKPEWDRK